MIHNDDTVIRLIHAADSSHPKQLIITVRFLSIHLTHQQLARLIGCF